MTYLECSCGAVLHSKTMSQTWGDHKKSPGQHSEVRRYSFQRQEVPS